MYRFLVQNLSIYMSLIGQHAIKIYLFCCLYVQWVQIANHIGKGYFHKYCWPFPRYFTFNTNCTSIPSITFLKEVCPYYFQCKILHIIIKIVQLLKPFFPIFHSRIAHYLSSSFGTGTLFFYKMLHMQY